MLTCRSVQSAQNTHIHTSISQSADDFELHGVEELLIN